MAKESRSKSVMGGGKKKSKSSGKHPHSIHVRRGASGGFIATHHQKSKPGEMEQEPEDHVLQDMPQLQQHMADHMSDQPEAPEPPPQAAAPAPQAAPAGM